MGTNLQRRACIKLHMLNMVSAGDISSGSPLAAMWFDSSSDCKALHCTSGSSVGAASEEDRGEDAGVQWRHMMLTISFTQKAPQKLFWALLHTAAAAQSLSASAVQAAIRLQRSSITTTRPLRGSRLNTVLLLKNACMSSLKLPPSCSSSDSSEFLPWLLRIQRHKNKR